MASMTTFISFFVLLLATYSYSLPLGEFFGNSTADYEFTTGHTIIDHNNTFIMHLVNEEDSTNVPTIHKVREYDEQVPVEDESISSTTPASDLELEDKEVRGFSDELFTTMESKIDFHARAIRPSESAEEFETSTSAFPEHEMTTDVESLSTSSSEPELFTKENESSFDSFGKATGLFHEDHTEQSSTSDEHEHEHHDQSDEKTTIRSPVKNQRLTQTISILPGKVTETKFYSNEPTKTYVVSQKYQTRPQQLSQVEQ